VVTLPARIVLGELLSLPVVTPGAACDMLVASDKFGGCYLANALVCCLRSLGLAEAHLGAFGYEVSTLQRHRPPVTRL
jgi:hypothetical protein